MPLRHCPTCGQQTRHRHMHDCAHGMPETHMHGSERFECNGCGKATFAHDDEAGRFPFTLDVAEGRSAYAHAMVRP
jgi:hypothetical protein